MKVITERLDYVRFTSARLNHVEDEKKLNFRLWSNGPDGALGVDNIQSTGHKETLLLKKSTWYKRSDSEKKI